MAESDARRRIVFEKLAVRRFQIQQRPQFAAGMQILLTLEKYAGIVGARGTIVRRQLQNGLEQQFRVIQHVALEADPRQ